MNGAIPLFPFPHLNDVQRDTFICTIPRICRQNVNPNDLYTADTRFKSQAEHKIFLVFFVFVFPQISPDRAAQINHIFSLCIYVNLSL